MTANEDLLPDNPPSAAQVVHIDDIWPVIERFLDSLHRVEERALARRILIGRLKHPELGGHPRPAPRIPPSGWGPSRTAGPWCARCGSPRHYHDIDGQNDSCDGYVEAR